MASMTKPRWIRFYYVEARNRGRRIDFRYVSDFIDWIHDIRRSDPKKLLFDRGDGTYIFIDDIRRGSSLSGSNYYLGEVGYIRREAVPKVIDLLTFSTAPPPSLGKNKEFFDATHFNIQIVEDVPVLVYEYFRFAPTPRIFGYKYLTILFRKWNEEMHNGRFGQKPIIEIHTIYRTRGLEFLRRAEKIKRIYVEFGYESLRTSLLQDFMSIVGLSLAPTKRTKRIYTLVIKPEGRGKYIDIDPDELYELLSPAIDILKDIFDKFEITVEYDNGRRETINVLADELKVQHPIKLFEDPKTHQPSKVTDSEHAYTVLQNSFNDNINEIRDYVRYILGR